MGDADFDYIVIGSGAGGGPLAARLAEANHNVLLIEAGGTDDPKADPKQRNWNYQVPVFHGRATEDKEMRLDFYVRHYEDEQRQEKDPKYIVERNAGRRGVYYPRARTVGGCTAHIRLRLRDMARTAGCQHGSQALSAWHATPFATMIHRLARSLLTL